MVIAPLLTRTPDIDPDNSLANSDTAEVGANLGPVNPNVGTGNYADSYVFNLLVAACVGNVPGATYSCTRTVQARVWAFNWDGTYWNVRQINVGETGFPTPIGDGHGFDGLSPLGPTENATTTVSPKGVLYYDDSPGLPCVDAAKELSIGDCMYVEKRFVYTLTIILGPQSVVRTFTIGEKLKLTEVAYYTEDDPRDFGDPIKNFISVSSVNLPTGYMTTDKAANLVGTDRSHIHFSPNVNANDP